MRTAGIYAITNLKNGKTYIGSTIDFERRWKEHRDSLCKGAHGNSHLQSSWDKYSESAFEFGILEYLDNLDELVKAEQFWMDVYGEEGRELYNFGLAADNPMRGRKHTEDTRQQMRESHKGMLGKHHSEESRRKIGDARRGKTLSEEHRHKLSEARKGKSSGMLGKHHSEESKRKNSESQMGKKHSEETKCKISVANKRAWARRKGDMAARGTE